MGCEANVYAGNFWNVGSSIERADMNGIVATGRTNISPDVVNSFKPTAPPVASPAASPDPDVSYVVSPTATSNPNSSDCVKLVGLFD